MRPIDSNANSYRGARRELEETRESGRSSASTSADARANAWPDLRRRPGPRETDSVLAPRANMAPRVGISARTPGRPELDPTGWHDSLARKRLFEAPADTLEARKRQRPDAPPSDTRGTQTSQYTRASSSSQEPGPTSEQLAECESRLGRADLDRLQGERTWAQQQLTSGKSLNRQNDDLFQMARGNVLAQRNEYGLALPFLDPKAAPEMNAEWLDRYLLLLSKRNTRDKWVERCTDLAAHYLFSTDWFEGLPPRRLAYLGNKLKKHPDRTACMQAVAWIAGQVLNADKLPQLDRKASALLLNAFAKNPNSARCEGAVARLGRMLLDQRPIFTPLDISLSLNTFSKWPGNPDCRTAAEHLAAHLAGSVGLQHAMRAQEVANTLNALSKWPQRPACQHAVQGLAKRLADGAGLRQAMNAQDVANTLNALSKWPERPACQNAIVSLATRIADDVGLQRAMNAQEVANTLNALGKWPERPACQNAIVSLATRIAHEAGLQRSLEAQHVANALNALKKFPEQVACRRAAEGLAKRLADDAGLRQAMSAQDVANTLNALGKWPERPACQHAAEGLAKRLQRDVALQRAMDAPQVAGTLNGLSKWPEGPACQHAAESLASRIARDVGLQRAMNAQAFANTLNALSKWPERAACQDAADGLAKRLVNDADLQQAMNGQDVANTLNALSKWPERPAVQDAADGLATLLADDVDLQRAMDAQAIANTLNALIKWPGRPACQHAAEGLAERLADDPVLQQAMEAQEVANTLNALGKWPERPACQNAIVSLATRIAHEAGLQRSLEAQHVANALNALKKFPEQAACRHAAEGLAKRLADEAGLRQAMNAQDVANTLNALGKWPERPASQHAAEGLAKRLQRDVALQRAMDAPQIAVTLNGLSKWPEGPACQHAAESLASRIARDVGLQRAMNAQAFANTLNALSKWPERAACQDAADGLVRRLADDASLQRAMNAQDVANTLNALSKWPERPAVQDAADELSKRLADDVDLQRTMNVQDVANTLNALSKWPERPAVQDAADGVAERLSGDVDLQRAMNVRDVANTLNALSKWPERPACRRTSVLLATRLGETGHRWRDFDMGALAQVGNALSRLHVVASDDAEVATLSKARLQGLAAHLELHRDRFDAASIQHVAMIFKAMAVVQLQRDMRPLARPALARISALCRETGLRETDLESIGTLCQGLLPLARSPVLACHRRQALSVFEEMQPIVARKIDRFLQAQRTHASADASRASRSDEEYKARRPALTFYQVLKAYALASRQWKPRYVGGARDAVRERQSQLTAWVQQTLERTREAIESDLGEMSWNVIAHIEAGDDVLNALDLRMLKETETITRGQAPARFELNAAHRSMRTEPGKPAALSSGAGDTKHVVIDMLGKELKNNAAETDKPYSLFARLTGQPLVEVELPGEVSAFMLARTISYQGEQWRFDLFGGSRLSRGGQSRPNTILAGGATPASMLPAIRYADTAPGSDLMNLAAKLAPQREDWSRMQRALLEMVPRDHVVEGTLRMGFFDDVPGPQHPFKLSGPAGQRIALCPNDGCGFLKFDVAMRIPAFRKYVEAWEAARAGRATNEQRDLVAVDTATNRLAPQALQHFPRDEQALEEAHQAMQRRLERLPPDIDKLTLFTLAVSGGYEGRKIRVVPSADDKVYLPPERSAAFDAEGGALLIGKAPYDKENLLPVPEDRVATVAKGDATSHFLSQCFAIQYSYTGFNDDDDQGSDAEMLHSKGMLIVPPAQFWSPEHEHMDLACSKEDMKTLSRWTAGRDRSAAPRDMLSTGSLRVKEIVLPGRLGALPIAELRKRNMDTDGDDAFVYAGYPKLVALITRVMNERAAKRGAPRSFKPPKTATPAFDPDSGRYQPGRASEILAEQRGRRLMGSASTLAARFLSQPDEVREAMARDMMFGTYDGIERSLRNGLRHALESEQRDPQALVALRAQAQQALARAHMPEAREAAALLHEQVRLLQEPEAGAPPPVPAALAERFPQLAQAYECADGVPQRIHAILDNYPVCRLGHDQFPEGQPGLIENEPELTMRNLFTLAIKVGTDALKSDTGTELFSKVVEACQRSESAHAGRVRSVPHGKETARAMRDESFDPEEVKSVLQRMPTMAAGVMHDAVQSLQQLGALPEQEVPEVRLRKLRAEDIAHAAQELAERARRMDGETTTLLREVALAAGATLAGEQHRCKSRSSLTEKLQRLLALKHKTLDEAVATVNDALRYSVLLAPQDFAEGFRRILAELDKKGHARTKQTNHFTKAHPFSAVSVTLRNPAGALWEIQFHTPETFDLKERFHDMYKSSFAMRLKGSSGAEVREFTRPAWLAFRALPMPPGCEEIDDWEIEQARPIVRRTPVAPKPAAPQARHAQQVLQIRQRARALEERFSPLMRRLAPEFGARLKGEQNWLAHVIKNEASTAEKISRLQRQHGLTADAAAARVRDGLRYVVELAPDQFTAGVRGMLQHLGTAGLRTMRINNTFAVEGTTYAGLNVNLRTQEGADFEIQFHTPDSIAAKLKTHKYYEKLRKLPMDLPGGDNDDDDGMLDSLRADRDRLTERLREGARQVPRPPGVEQIASFDRYFEVLSPTDR